jgi:hypothetical protein
MATWTFYDFIEERGTNPIRDWLDGVPERASIKINTRILFLAGVASWPEQYVSSFTGWPKLLELRVVSSGVQYRPLGFYGPEAREFTFVLGTIEKGEIPPRILKVADGIRKLIIATGRTRIRLHEFDKAPDAGRPKGK